LAIGLLLGEENPAQRQRHYAFSLLSPVESVNVHTLQATIAETNTASRRTAERSGFHLIGTSPETCPNGDSQEQGLQYELQT